VEVLATKITCTPSGCKILLQSTILGKNTSLTLRAVVLILNQMLKLHKRRKLIRFMKCLKVVLLSRAQEVAPAREKSKIQLTSIESYVLCTLMDI
jgi:hypothetical protein